MTKVQAYSGATLSISFTCKDELGDPVDLTGFTARAEVRPTISSEVLTLDLAPTIPTPANGVIVVSVSDEITAGIEAGNYVWGLVLETPEGNVIPIESGPILFRQIVPREA
jgi:hypothetical protein